jgi:S1-C subfamily serine protease
VEPPANTQVEHAYIAGHHQGYLGVLYGTAEDGRAGVKVLGIIEGSPAQRAGFQGPVRSPTWQDQAIKLAIPLLVLSPAAPLAIPLAIVHDVYRNHEDSGDLIIEVAGQPVQDAQEFTKVMRRFGPGDTVSFAVLRGDRRVNLSARLEGEPS